MTVPRGLSLLDEGDSRHATVPEIDPDLPQSALARAEFKMIEFVFSSEARQSILWCSEWIAASLRQLPQPVLSACKAVEGFLVGDDSTISHQALERAMSSRALSGQTPREITALVSTEQPSARKA